MGHLVNPLTYRLSKSKFWISSWNNITKKNYKLFFLEDYNLIKFYNWIKIILNWNKINLEILPLNLIKTYKYLILNIYIINDGYKSLKTELRFKKLKYNNYFKFSKKTILTNLLERYILNKFKQRKKNNFFYKKIYFNFNSKKKNKKRRKKDFFFFKNWMLDRKLNKIRLLYNIKLLKFYKKKIIEIILNKLDKKKNFRFIKFKKYFLFNKKYKFITYKKSKNFIFMQNFKWFNFFRLFMNRRLLRLKNFIKIKKFLNFDSKFIYVVKNFLLFFIEKIFGINNAIINIIDKKNVNYSAESFHKLILWRLNVGFKIEHYVNLLSNKLKREDGIIGYKIAYAGRYKKKLRNKKFINNFGAISPSNMNSPISYVNFVIIMRYGICGVKMHFVRKVYIASLI